MAITRRNVNYSYDFLQRIEKIYLQIYFQDSCERYTGCSIKILDVINVWTAPESRTRSKTEAKTCPHWNLYFGKIKAYMVSQKRVRNSINFFKSVSRLMYFFKKKIYCARLSLFIVSRSLYILLLYWRKLFALIWGPWWTSNCIGDRSNFSAEISVDSVVSNVVEAQNG